MADIPREKFYNNKEIPVIGLGTWRIPKEKTKEVVIEAIENQHYRHIDCAEFYLNEKEVGDALKEVLELKKAKVTRKDLFITSKLWNTHHDPKHVEEACRNTLKKLGCEYLDLYLIHQPFAFKFTKLDIEKEEDGFPQIKEGRGELDMKVKMEDTWRAMESLVEKGLVKSIGVSNFPMNTVVDICTYAKIKPAVNQVECHPYFNQNSLIEDCKELGVHVEAYSPLAGGEATEKLMNDEVLTKIAKKHKKTVPQICLKWQTQRGIPTIPKSVHKERMHENINLFDFVLDDEEMKEINELGTKKRQRVWHTKSWYGWEAFD